jgi:hypothetical protein
MHPPGTWSTPIPIYGAKGKEQIGCKDRPPHRHTGPTFTVPAEEPLGRKDDLGKLRWDLVQPLILQEYVKVLTFGAQKYAPNNWRLVADHKNRYFAALLRHLWAWMFLGERNDPESGLHHLGHAMCCVTFLAEPELEASVKKMVDLEPDLQHPPCPDCGSTSGKCVIGTETSPNDPVVMGKQFAMELMAAERFGPGAISEMLGRRLLTHYGWAPKGVNSWQRPYGATIMTTEEALKTHGYRLVSDEDVVESDHEHPTDDRGVRESDSSGPEGSGGRRPGDG